MNDEAKKEYYLTNSDSNTERARVDDVVLLKGNKENPVELTEDQVKRLKAAGLKVNLASDPDDGDDSDETTNDNDEVAPEDGPGNEDAGLPPPPKPPFPRGRN